MIRGILFAVAIAWLGVNLAGLFMVELRSEPTHAAIHIFFVALFAVAAYLLRPWKRKRPPAVAGNASTQLLSEEIDRLQRELDEAQQGRDFAEDLLRRRPGPTDAN